MLDWKTEKGKRYGLVKWIGYDDTYNSWEPEDIPEINGRIFFVSFTQYCKNNI